MSDQFTRASRRALRRNGRPVTVETPVFATDPAGDVVYDDQGDPVLADTSPASAETHAETVVRGNPQFVRRVGGTDADVDAIIWLPDTVPDDHGVPVTTGEGDVEQATTTIVVPDSGRYRVVHVHRQRDGRLRCACHRAGNATAD